MFPVWHVKMSGLFQREYRVTHEDFSRSEKTKTSSNRSFGFVIGSAFLLIGLVPLFHPPYQPRWLAIAIGAIFAGFARFRPDLLSFLNSLWLRFGLLLHKIVSPVILGLLFFTTVLPVGLLMRAFGKDPLRLHRDPAAEAIGCRASRPARRPNP